MVNSDFDKLLDNLSYKTVLKTVNLNIPNTLVMKLTGRNVWRF